MPPKKPRKYEFICIDISNDMQEIQAKQATTEV
jgi:hypothetical protein